MKLSFLNTFFKRIGFSLTMGLIAMLVYNLYRGGWSFDPAFILMIAVICFIPVTVVYAVVSTFFVKEDEEESEDILDN